MTGWTSLIRSLDTTGTPHRAVYYCRQGLVSGIPIPSDNVRACMGCERSDPPRAWCIDSVAIFREDQLLRLVVMASMRTSFQDDDRIPVLYDLEFSSRSCAAHAYRVSGEQMTLVRSDVCTTSEIAPCAKLFSGTPLEITLATVGGVEECHAALVSRRGVLLSWVSGTTHPLTNASLALELFLSQRSVGFEEVVKFLSEVATDHTLRNRAILKFCCHWRHLDRIQQLQLISSDKSIPDEVKALMEEVLARGPDAVACQELNRMLRPWPYQLDEAAAAFCSRYFPGCDTSSSVFTELDLDPASVVTDASSGTIDANFGELTTVDRDLGGNDSCMYVGIIEQCLGLDKPVRRILIAGDLSGERRGTIDAAECARINAAIRLAAKEKIPIDWFSAAYGVTISHDRGVEGLDASATTVRHIIEYCRDHGVRINLIVDRANIGAQSYWTALATILEESTGLLIMTPTGSLALTGPKAFVAALIRMRVVRVSLKKWNISIRMGCKI
jgi:hypothetical protein